MDLEQIIGLYEGLFFIVIFFFLFLVILFIVAMFSIIKIKNIIEYEANYQKTVRKRKYEKLNAEKNKNNEMNNSEE